MQLRQAVFYSTDTATALTAYRFSVERINISVKEILPLVLEKKIIIDSLKLLGPHIQVTRLRAPADSDTTGDNNSLSMPQEMGRVYKSIQDALQVLSVTKFHIDNGTFTLINKIRTDELPVTITNIQLHLDNLKVDTNHSESKQKILFSDNVALQTHAQNILFPDGRHRLSFAHFGINIAKKRVEFDSCTIAASKEDSSQTSFRIFFDKLLLTNIDFDTLYLKEIIKADSVYCINPQFTLDAHLGKKTGSPKAPPKLNELIQQMTGDLRIGYVVVQNGSFAINTIRDGKPSSFTSSNNNFEMQGLRIDQKSAHPLTVKSLAMAIRNYENFLRDSTYALQFDSVLLVNNSINLSNFSVKQMQGDKEVNSFTIPNFQLREFSWDDLVFGQKLSSGQATLYRPVINYSFGTNAGKGASRQNIFKTLASIGDNIQLSNLYITDGRINLDFRDGTKLELENAHIFLAGRDLVQSKKITSLQKSVRRLRFTHGTLSSGNLLIEMENADITGTNGELVAEKMTIADKRDNFHIDARQVSVASIITDNNSSITEINDIKWKQADITLKGGATGKTIPGIVVRAIRGENTKFSSSGSDHRLTAFFESLSADEFVPEADNKFRIKNLVTTGKQLSYDGNGFGISMAQFNLADQRSSSVKDLSIKNFSATDSLQADIPSLSFVPDLNAIIRGAIKADELTMSRPRISINRSMADDNSGRKKLPDVSIGKITVQQPDFVFNDPGNTGFTNIEWHSKEEKNNSVEISGLKIDEKNGISADKLLFSLADFVMEASGKKFNAGEGQLKTEIKNFYIRRAESGEWNWHADIKDLRAINFLFDNLGRNAGRLELRSIDLDNLAISSSTILNLRQLLMENKNFRVTGITGQYENTKMHIDWMNAGYDKRAKKLSLYSFNYRPVLSKNDFVAAQQYQTDYITLRTGPIDIQSFDIDRYLGDTVLKAKHILINDVVMENYRDKRLPFRAGIIKLLPVEALKKISVQLDVDELELKNAQISYAELNNKTNQEGVVNFDKLHARVRSIGNTRFSPADSLVVEAEADLLDSLHISFLFKQSYTDTAGGFRMKANISGGNGQLLNRVTEPLASVRVASGVIDSVRLHALGNSRGANAEMRLIYHDLKVKILNNTVGSTKKGPFRNFASFFANAFAIRNNNRSKTVPVYFERVRERSVFHYLWKISLKGITSSIGLKKS